MRVFLMDIEQDERPVVEPIPDVEFVGLTLFAEGEFRDRDVPWPGPIGRVFYDEGAE